MSRERPREWRDSRRVRRNKAGGGVESRHAKRCWPSLRKPTGRAGEQPLSGAVESARNCSAGVATGPPAPPFVIMSTQSKYTAFRCPEDLLKKAKIKAAKDRRSLSNYIINLIAKDTEQE